MHFRPVTCMRHLKVYITCVAHICNKLVYLACDRQSKPENVLWYFCFVFNLIGQFKCYRCQSGMEF